MTLFHAHDSCRSRSQTNKGDGGLVAARERVEIHYTHIFCEFAMASIKGEQQQQLSHYVDYQPSSFEM
jgi:hypothetical protein